MTTDCASLQKKNTILIRALIISGVINIVVLSFLSYWIIRERPPSPYCELKPQKKEHLLTIVDSSVWRSKLNKMQLLSLNQLIDLLSSHRAISNYQEKDIALGYLTTFHHFDLQRALMPQNMPLDRYQLKWNGLSNQPITLSIYPFLKESDFLAIRQFAKTERWPLTTQGLFLKYQEQRKQSTIDPRLIETLAMTSEFWSMELLLNRGDAPALTKTEIANLITEGNWEALTLFVEQQKSNHDLSDERRRLVLLEYVKLFSQSAAEFLVRLDKEYLLENIDEVQITSLLKLLVKKSEENETFAKQLLLRTHNDQVWRGAATLLYFYADEKTPAVLNHSQVINRFLSPTLEKKTQPLTSLNLSFQPSKKETPSEASKKPLKETYLVQKKFFTYSVKKGDSLWKISRKFKVKMAEIRDFNQLTSDSIKEGSVLKIPNPSSKF